MASFALSCFLGVAGTNLLKDSSLLCQIDFHRIVVAMAGPCIAKLLPAIAFQRIIAPVRALAGNHGLLVFLVDKIAAFWLCTMFTIASGEGAGYRLYNSGRLLEVGFARFFLFVRQDFCRI